MIRRKLGDESSQPTLRLDDLRVWVHPAVANAVDALEILSIDPGGGRLAGWLTLAFDELASNYDLCAAAPTMAKTRAAREVRNRVFEWLMHEVESASYHIDPSKSTNQVERAVSCAFLLFCAQNLCWRLPENVRKKANIYLRYMSERSWPRDNLVPFIASQLSGPSDLVASARQYLMDQAEGWRARGHVRGIAFVLLQCRKELDSVQVNELIATLVAKLAVTSLDSSDKAWGLLALSQCEGVAKSLVNGLAESVLDELSQDQMVSSDVAPTIRLLSQFPFSTPAEISQTIDVLKKRGHGPAKRVKEVSSRGVTIDLFSASSGQPWSFALHATQMAFAIYAVALTGHDRIVGFPAHYRAELEDSVRNHHDLQTQEASTIPVSFIKWYNTFVVLGTLEISGVAGAVTALLLGREPRTGFQVGIGATAVMLLSLVFSRGRKVFGRELILVEVRDLLISKLMRLLRVLGLE